MRKLVRINVAVSAIDNTAPAFTVSGSGPYTVGMAFRKGQYRDADLGGQWTTKNKWNDGSVKIGQRSGIGSAGRVNFKGPKATGAALTLADLQATGVTARIEVVGHGVAEWSDWSQPQEQWISGPVMSSWLYFKRLNASNWLTAWVEVRLYANGQVSILPSIENGYVRAPGRGLQSGRVTFAINGEMRYDSVRTAWIYDHARYILAENADGWHWTGTRPDAFPRVDTRYLMSTGLVPNYPFGPPDTKTLDGYAAGIIPFTFVDQQRRPAPMSEEQHGVADMPGVWEPAADGWHLRGGIGAGGYHDSIGVLPRWDAMYLTSNGSERAMRAMVANHAACGLGWYHMRRDDMSGDIHRWSDTPRMGYGGTAVDMYKVPKYEPVYYSWGVTHMPQVGLLPYLVTGAKYWCDETIMLGVFTGQSLVPTARAGLQKGEALTDEKSLRMIVWEGSAYQPRGAAWAHRAIACAAAAAPDGHPNKQPFVDSMANTATFILDASVRGTSLLGPTFVNNLGQLPQTHSVSTPYGDDRYNTWIGAGWMMAFQVAAIGYGWDLVEDNFTDAQRDEYRQARDYAYKWTVGLTGVYPGGWNWRAAGTGAIGITKTLYLPSPGRPDSRFFDSHEQMWEQNVARMVSNGGAVENYTKYGMIDSNLGGSLFSYRYIGWVADTSYWANYLPSIAYAVKHNAPGAREGWERIKTASNYAEIASDASKYRNNPVWGIRP